VPGHRAVVSRVALACGLLCVLVSALILLPGSGTAQAADDTPDTICVEDTLDGAEVTASLRVVHAGQDDAQMNATLDIKVPRTWMWSFALLLSDETEEYRTAMRCLLRSPAVAAQYRDTEWQYHAPRISADRKWVTVSQRTTTQVIQLGPRDVGPWHIEAGARYWTLSLAPPPALAGARWSEVRVDLGGRPARSVQPPPTTGTSTLLTWHTPEKPDGPPPDIRLLLQPPAPEANSARWWSPPWSLADDLGWLSWDLAIAVLCLALIRTLAHHPPLALPTAEEQATRRNLELLVRVWLLIAVVHSMDDAFYAALPATLNVGGWFRLSVGRELMDLTLSAGLGLLLCLTGRPGRAGTMAVAAALGYVAAMVGWPSAFGLPPAMALHWANDPGEVAAFAGAGGAYWFALACAALVFVWLTGLVSVGLRLWRSSAPPAGPGPGTGSHGRVAPAVLGTLALVSCGVSAAGLAAAENWWHRVSWLADQSEGAGYAAFHTATTFNDQRWFPTEFTDWIPGYAQWWMCSLALLAVARAWRTAPGGVGAAPRPRELALLKVFFVVAAAPAVGWYGGIPLPLLSLAVVWLAMAALLALGRRWAVLSHELTPGVPLRDVITERHRTRLMTMARQHRELHAELRRLEQGQTEVKRAALERRLDRLHRWTPPHPGHRHSRVPLPHTVGPVELALAWGPRADWWDNACRAATVAALAGLPATGVLFWLSHVRGNLWTDKFSQRFGLPEIALNLASYELIYASAGFMLGALWRILPGRRGLGRGIGVGLVYLLPLLVDQLANTLTGQSGGNEVLDGALMVLVLTVTGTILDFDTFRQERRYWPTRAGLLLSLYQKRSASAQIALLIAQLVAVVTIWQQLSGNPPVVLIDHQGPSGSNVPGTDGGSGPGAGH
jgi:hypothetical protein